MRALLPIIFLLLAGCAGVDSESHFKCKAPEGVGCSSLSGTYANALEDNLPGSQVKKTVSDNKEPKERGITGVAPESGTPVLSQPIILRVWVAPWEDNRNVLHDQAYLYAVVDPGSWQIAHSKKRISEKYRAVTPVAQRAPAEQPKPRQPQFQPPNSGAQQ